MSGLVHASVDRLVEVLGLAATLKLAERFGGRRLYVPQPERLKPEGAIVATIGYDLAVKLAYEWRGLEIVVPQCAAYVRRARDRAIHADAAAMPVAEISRKWGMTERHVFRILAEPPPADEAGAADARRLAQPSLFPDG